MTLSRKEINESLHDVMHATVAISLKANKFVEISKYLDMFSKHLQIFNRCHKSI